MPQEPLKRGGGGLDLSQQADLAAGSVRALRAASLHERVLLVEAGPGWGKTTAVRAAFDAARYVETPSAGSPAGFHLAVLRALGFSPADAGSVTARLETDDDGVTRSIATAVAAGTQLILDDVQRLDPAGARLVEALVESQDVHLVLVGRSMAVFPVGSWMSRGLVGMPFGPDTLALRADGVRAMLDGLSYTPDLLGAIVSTFGGWPIAASLAGSMLRRGYPADRVLAQLGEGMATVVGAALNELPAAQRRALIEAALTTAHGIVPSGRASATIRRLGFPESACGLHEIIVAAVLHSVTADERTAVAQSVDLCAVESAAAYALLAAEAPHALADRSWQLLAPLHDRYDRATLQRMAAHPHVPPAAAEAARCFLLIFSSRYGEAAHIAERILADVARNSPAAALRLVRALVFDGRGAAAVTILRTLQSDDPDVVVHRECLLANILGERSRLQTAMDSATRGGDLSLVAFAGVHAAIIAARAGDLDEAEGMASRAEDAARAAGSVLLEARALKIRYGIAALRANLDLAAVHVGRLVSLQTLVGDPDERASDLVAAFEIEVLSGRAGRAAAYDDAIRKMGHGWLGMETYIVCRAILDAWDGLLLSATDRVAAFASAAPQQLQRLPYALGAFFAAAAGASERAADLLARLSPGFPPTADRFAIAHYEMASSFAAMAHALLGRPGACAAYLKSEPRTAFGAVFIDAARRYAVHRDIGVYAETMRSAGLSGIAMMSESCNRDGERTALSRAERSVLSYLASGMDAPHIASLTGRSLHTIKNQRRSIISKLGAGNTVEAVAIARRLGLL